MTKTTQEAVQMIDLGFEYGCGYHCGRKSFKKQKLLYLGPKTENVCSPCLDALSLDGTQPSVVIPPRQPLFFSPPSATCVELDRIKKHADHLASLDIVCVEAESTQWMK